MIFTSHGLNLLSYSVKHKSMAGFIPIWDKNACTPRREILEGTLTEAELALSLSAVASGKAKFPYDDPVEFFRATHLTTNMKLILEDILGRLSLKRRDVNPIIVLDVGFGGGKTHTLVTLYYAAKFGENPELAPYLAKLPKPKGVRVVTISGDEYGSEGIRRNKTQIRTIWGDLIWQLGKYEKYKDLDKKAMVPSKDDMRDVIEGGPVLVLLDELPTYLNLAAQEAGMLDKTVQWIQRLVLAISEKEDAALVIAIAEDVYGLEAERAKHAIQEAAKEALEKVRAHIRRKELILVPIEEEDVVHILKRRLFNKISTEVAKNTADAYYELYKDLPVPEELKGKAFRDEIEKHYPFHPMLIKVLYERVATFDKFHRTRGALRLLARVVRRIWAEKEADAALIHPFHVDLADQGILSDLSEGIGEGKMRNAVEADVWSSDGGAIAQTLDEQGKAHWKVPLMRRAANTIYLYSLATGRESTRGIHSDMLASLCTTPARRELFFTIRDTGLPWLSDRFTYIDRRGERFVFVREPTPVRVIELCARDVTEEEVMRVVLDTLTSSFAGDPEWVHVEMFPSSPDEFRDDPFVKVAILNPNLYTIKAGKVSEDVAKFITYKDAYGKRLRQFSNSTFLLVASEDKLETMRLTARKVGAAMMVREDLPRYGIPKERKSDVEEYLARQEKYLNDYIRAAFSYLVYCDRDGVKLGAISASGYGAAKSGRAVIAHYLIEVLQRVKDSSLDPTYVLSYAWPKGGVSISTKALYEQFHAVPGLILPATKELFQDTVERGIKEGAWVLKKGDEIYKPEKLPTIVPIAEDAEMLTFEEAERRGLLAEEKRGRRVEEGAERKEWEGAGPAPVETVTLASAPVKVLAEDLEKRIRRGRFNQVEYLNLRMAGKHLYLLDVKNLLTRISSDKTCSARVTTDLGRSKAPLYTVHFDLNKDDVGREEGKTILDLAWRLKGVESCTISLMLEWPDGASPEDVVTLLRGLAEGSKEEIVASLEGRVRRS